MSLNNLNISELENYLNTIFNVQNGTLDKVTAAIELELQIDALYSKIDETGSLQHARCTSRT